ncbi:DUF4139 domain-containing protein [Thermodesulfobacteriota bacterium]
MKQILFALTCVFAFTGFAESKVDLVTLPGRETVQLTIYNSADLTLARESRILTLKKGLNKFQFSWANTLIDPTSLEIRPQTHADRIDILDLTYPPRIRNLGLWNIESQISGKVPVEIDYLTSGLSWRAFYLGTLSADEKTMLLKGYVRVTNGSGEDYENAQIRVIVGKIHILDRIADLARRRHPYGRPEVGVPDEELRQVKMAKMAFEQAEVMKAMPEEAPRVKEIKKEGLSEYFLYTIEGKEMIPNGWSKRLPSFEARGVPVINLYKYEEERYGTDVVRFLSFKNDKDHELGMTPIPGGTLKVYRSIDKAGHLSYAGQSRFKYIPVGERVELNLGPVENVLVEPTLMNYKTDNFLFYKNGNISGWDEIRTFTVKVKNTRSTPVAVEVIRNFGTSTWKLKKEGDYGTYEKVDMDTVKFTVELRGKAHTKFHYTLTTFHGKRAE